MGEKNPSWAMLRKKKGRGSHEKVREKGMG